MSGAERDTHEVAVILELSHICMHCQSHDMSVVRMALEQHQLGFLCQDVKRFKEGEKKGGGEAN